MALYGTYLDLSALSTIREEQHNVEFPVSRVRRLLAFRLPPYPVHTAARALVAELVQQSLETLLTIVV